MFLRCPRCDYFIPTGNVGDVALCRACASPSVLRETLVESRPVGGENGYLELVFHLHWHLLSEAEFSELQAIAPHKALQIRRRRASLLC